MNRAALAILLLCTACTPLRYSATAIVPEDWPERRAALLELQHWNMQGRIRIRSGTANHLAKVNWMQRGDDYVLDISPPIGGSGYRLQGSTDSVIWQRPGKPPLQAASAEALLLEQLGWSIPLANARYWVIGLPDPTQQLDSSRFDQGGRLREFTQSGWQVYISDYHPAPSLPARLQLTHQDGLELRLHIHAWRTDY